MKINILTQVFLVTLLASVLFVACEKDEINAINPADKNTVTLEFDNRVGSKPMVLNTATYKNGAGEEFTVTAFNYFVSNVALTKSDGSVLKFPDQYFLVRQADAKTLTADLPNVPAGDYKNVSFTVGVDSSRSVADVSLRTGVLDVASYGDDGMYWSWNSGYIFLKLEGTSPVVPTRTDGRKLFQMHVGGFGGMTSKMTNNLRSVSLPLTSPATVRGNVAPEVHLFVDAMSIFDGKTPIKLAQTNSVHNPALATPIADNYVGMFSVDHVHNDKQ